MQRAYMLQVSPYRGAFTSLLIMFAQYFVSQKPSTVVFNTKWCSQWCCETIHGAVVSSELRLDRLSKAIATMIVLFVKNSGF